MSSFRDKVIKLAYENQHLRPALLPLLKEAGGGLWLDPDPQATIRGKASYEPIWDEVYKSMSRRDKWNAVGLANNSKPLGFGTAILNGKQTQGIYFRATNGSAEGVAWNSGMLVYQVLDRKAEELLPGPPKLWFTPESRKGVRIQSSDKSAYTHEDYAAHLRVLKSLRVGDGVRIGYKKSSSSPVSYTVRQVVGLDAYKGRGVYIAPKGKAWGGERSLDGMIADYGPSTGVVWQPTMRQQVNRIFDIERLPGA